MFKIKLLIIYSAIAFLHAAAFVKDTIDIAAIYALTGDVAEDNAGSVQGVRYAVDETNEQGGILGKKINLLLLDNHGTAIGSNVAAEQAARAGVTAIIGPQWSSLLKA